MSLLQLAAREQQERESRKFKKTRVPLLLLKHTFVASFLQPWPAVEQYVRVQGSGLRVQGLGFTV